MIDTLPEGTHTVVLAIGDLNGIARGKRLQANMWERTAQHGVALANALFQMDMTCDIWDTPYGNFDNGYPDVHIVPIPGKLRKVPWEEGVVLTMCRSEEVIDHAPVPVDPRNALLTAVERAADLGYEVMVGTELEFYLLDPETRRPRDVGIDVYGLARAKQFEFVVGPIRNLCTEFGILVEVSNPEYAPGQFEVNLRYTDALTAADNTVLFRHAVKEIAADHGMLATFMAKPFTEESGSGFHVHQSLWKDGQNAFSDGGRLSELGRRYLGGLRRHMADLALLSAPNPNAMRRRQPYTFCPTNNTWGMDNRTVGIRVIEGEPTAVRIEQRDGSADANPYLLIAGQVAAGIDGIEHGLDPGPMTAGNGYEVTDAEVLPTTIPEAIERFEASELVRGLIHPMLVETLVGQARREQEFVMNSGEDDPEATVTQVEVDRYLGAF